MFVVRNVSERLCLALGEIHLAHEVEMQMTSYLQSCCSGLRKISPIVSSLVYPSSIALPVTVRGRGLQYVMSLLYNLPVLYLQLS